MLLYGTSSIKETERRRQNEVVMTACGREICLVQKFDEERGREWKKWWETGEGEAKKEEAEEEERKENKEQWKVSG